MATLMTQAELAERGAAALVEQYLAQIEAIYKQFPALKQDAANAKRAATIAAGKKAKGAAGGAGSPGDGGKSALSKDEIKAKREATMLARYGTTDLKEIAKIKKAQADAEVAAGATAGAANSETGAVAGQEAPGDAIELADEAQAPATATA